MNARLSNADLAHYARHTAKRPLLCFLGIALSPFAVELICRLAGA